MNLSSSFDHRLIDGYVAAEFIQQLKALLESPVTLGELASLEQPVAP